MKKLAVKPRRPKVKKRGAIRREIRLEDVDLSVLRMLLASGQVEGQSLEDTIDEFLQVRPEGVEDLPDVEVMSQLAEELERVRI
jgi:hypothetical protein